MKNEIVGLRWALLGCRFDWACQWTVRLLGFVGLPFGSRLRALPLNRAVVGLRWAAIGFAFTSPANEHYDCWALLGFVGLPI